MSLVLDSSVALTWIYADEGDEHTELVLQRIAQSEAWVPAIWRLEVANSLQQGLKRGRLDLDDRDLGLADLSKLKIQSIQTRMPTPGRRPLISLPASN